MTRLTSMALALFSRSWVRAVHAKRYRKQVSDGLLQGKSDDQLPHHHLLRKNTAD